MELDQKQVKVVTVDRQSYIGFGPFLLLRAEAEQLALGILAAIEEDAIAGVMRRLLNETRPATQEQIEDIKNLAHELGAIRYAQAQADVGVPVNQHPSRLSDTQAERLIARLREIKAARETETILDED